MYRRLISLGAIAAVLTHTPLVVAPDTARGANDAVGLFAALPETHPGPQPVSALFNTATSAVLGDRILFPANTMPVGMRSMALWRSDGSADGTQPILDPGLGATTFVGPIAELPHVALLGMEDGANGAELWRSDGTGEGTYLLKDLLPGADGSHPGRFTISGAQAYFVAFDTGHATQVLWVSDGTRDGTQRLGVFDDIREMYVMPSGALLFVAREPAAGIELWFSDGTAGGTRLVRDIRPGSDSSDPKSLRVLHSGYVLFSALTVEQGEELWITDGTRDNTYLVNDIAQGVGIVSSAPRMLTTLTLTLEGGNPIVSMLLSASVSGRSSLWVSNGLRDTIINTTTVVRNTREIYRSGTASPSALIGTRTLTTPDAVYDIAIVAMVSAASQPGIWVTDGSAAGTTVVANNIEVDAQSQGFSIARLGTAFFFPARTSAHGTELWTSDGTVAGTRRVSDLRPGPAHSSPRELTTYRRLRVFQRRQRAGPRAVCRRTRRRGCVVQGIWPGEADGMTKILGITNDRLYFIGNDGVAGDELWVTDGTRGGTRMVRNIAPDLAGLSGNIVAAPEYAQAMRPDDRLILGNVVHDAGDSPVFGEVWSAEAGAGRVTRLARFVQVERSGDSPPMDFVTLAAGGRRCSRHPVLENAASTIGARSGRPVMCSA